MCLAMPLLIVALFGCSCSSAPDYSATIAEGRTAIKEAMDESGASSLSVALVDGDRVILSESFGMAEREAGGKTTSDSIYVTCSLSNMTAISTSLPIAVQTVPPCFPASTAST